MNRIGPARRHNDRHRRLCRGAQTEIVASPQHEHEWFLDAPGLSDWRITLATPATTEACNNGDLCDGQGLTSVPNYTGPTGAARLRPHGSRAEPTNVQT